MTEQLRVEYRKIETLIPFARNPRTHSEAQIAKLASSIVEFGWTQPILVDGTSGIIAGHDYGRASVGHVREAVTAWTSAYRIAPWFVLAGDRSPSFLWVQP